MSAGVAMVVSRLIVCDLLAPVQAQRMLLLVTILLGGAPAPTQVFWFFIRTVLGVMGGSWASGRPAGRLAPRRQVRWGYSAMMDMGLLGWTWVKRRPG